ncbi:MAG: phosphatidylglycerophosphatase A [Candidatus Kapaibacterium sp.]|jgi:phosphatidylglycerophosphatase A
MIERPKTDQHASGSSGPDWLVKARSRLWYKPKHDLSKVPAWALVISTFGFVGLSPIASGTMGSAVAALLYYYIPALQVNLTLAICTLVLLVIGIVASNVVEQKLKVNDPSIIVADEVIGQWIALLTLSYSGNLLFVIVAFVLFRLFDIIKLYPASFFERRPGGAGVMLDDAVAGIYANISAHLVMWIIYRFV